MYLRTRITLVLLWIIQKLNRWKDTSLSMKLHLMADHYDKRPSGWWEYTTQEGYINHTQDDDTDPMAYYEQVTCNKFIGSK